MNYYSELLGYSMQQATDPLVLHGDAADILPQFPVELVDCVMTSPPYWGHRVYDSGGIGLEETPDEYVENLLAITGHIRRVLKNTGSFWLNIGDSYSKKHLLGIPWRVALRMMDEQGWVLRNSVIWNKVKGSPDNSPNKLRNVHENVFHFVKNEKDYYYDVDAIRNTPSKSKIVNGSIVSATGVSGVRYKRQIELSTSLSSIEKVEALKALNEILLSVRTGVISDFRMIIRGQQRSTHSDSERVSGRARELAVKGFYFMKYHPNGTKPSDVWDIMPEDTQGRDSHFAPYPSDLCRIPIVATSPRGGIVLDPFCGTGTTLYVAKQLERRSIGIDLSAVYLKQAESRSAILL